MKKLLVWLIVLALSSFIVSAISLSVPHEKEYIFEPNKQIKLEFEIGNNDPQNANVQITVTAGELAAYIKEVERTISIPPYSSEKFILDLTFPETLKSGLYPIKVEASEKAELHGMAGLTGVGGAVTVISPYEQGFPHAEIFATQYNEPEKPINFAIEVKNIGKTQLYDIQGAVKLKQNGQTVKELTAGSIPSLQPYAERQLTGAIQTAGLKPGLYELEALIANQIFTKQITLGTPKINVIETSKIKAGEENAIRLKLSLTNWETEIKDAGIKMQMANLLTADQKATLVPGENIIEFQSKAQPGKSGKYKGSIVVTGNFISKLVMPFEADVEGSASISGNTGFEAVDARETNEAEDSNDIRTNNEPEAPKSKTFLIVLLIASLLLFTFALGQYLGRRGDKNNEPKITGP